MSNLLTEVELYLFKVLLSEAASPAVKSYALSQLKALETASTNKLFKAILEAVEGFLAAPAA